MTTFRTPPQVDFQAYATLIGQQGDHFGDTVKWSGDQCAKTGGLDGLLLLPLLEVVPTVAQFFHDELAQCQRGMGVVVDKVNRTSADYTSADQAAAAELRSLYPAVFAGFPGLGSVPGVSLVGDLTDHDIELKEPTSAEGGTSKAIQERLMVPYQSADLKAADHIFKWCTGQSLVELMLKPLFGEFGRVRYLHDAYDKLGDAAYTVAGTLRRGSWKLGSEWEGQTATAFDEYMFRWSMGIGGVGDAAKLAAKAFKDGYDVIVPLVWAAITEIDVLMETGIKKLAESAGKLLAGDAAIEAVGLGPEDPIADVIAGFWTAKSLYDIYQKIKKVINAIGLLQTIFQKISAAVDKIKKDVGLVLQTVRKGPPSIGSLISDVEQRGFEFEKNGFWSPELGVARIAALPAA